MTEITKDWTDPYRLFPIEKSYQYGLDDLVDEKPFLVKSCLWTVGAFATREEAVRALPDLMLEYPDDRFWVEDRIKDTNSLHYEFLHYDAITHEAYATISEALGVDGVSRSLHMINLYNRTNNISDTRDFLMKIRYAKDLVEESKRKFQNI